MQHGFRIQVVFDFINYFRPYRSQIIIAIFTLVFLTLGSLARPHILRYMIDGSLMGDWSTIIWGAISFIAILIASIGLSYAQLMITARIGINIVNRLKFEAFEKILNQDMWFFNKHKTGWLISRVESDCELLKEFCSKITIRMFMDAAVCFAILVNIAFVNIKIFSLLFILTVLICFFLRHYLGAIRVLYNDARDRYAELSAFLSEYIQGINIIQIFRRKQEVMKLLSAKGEKRYQSEIIAARTQYSVWALVGFITEALFLGVVLYFGIKEVSAGTLSIGELVMLLEFIRQLTHPINSFGENFNSIQRSIVAAERTQNILKLDQTVIDSAMDTGTKTRFKLIKFENVNFSYRQNNRVINELNLEIKKGQKIGIVGPSGGGKSTLSDLICRFYDPQEGKILIDNSDLKDISLKSWRRSIGLVLQDIFLFPGSILDNLRVFDQQMSEQRVVDCAKRMHIHEFIQNLPQGYDTELEERGANFSLGQRQLLSFTRAMVFDPELLILDEATASVDPYTENLILRSMNELLANRTSLVIAHRLKTIADCDRILFIRDGIITESGNHEELISSKSDYYSLFQLQNGSSLA
tara:strand:- start:6676 stop:8424 length:1749 start_codon:yes stop_codon:yes gene_type:complete